MCGIAGVARGGGRPVDPDSLRRMAGAIRHRGPDGYGFYVGASAGLAHVRLSIIDLEGGAQPLVNEDGNLVVVFNGEIFNYLELREELLACGHRFRTRSDTEVLVHGYEEWGAGMLERLNGQFAFALLDRRDDSIFLARDPFGIRPLFYALRDGDLHFASEAKALFAGGVSAEPDPVGLDQIFTFWAARAPQTPFRGVSTLEPGSFALWRGGSLKTSRYFRPDYAEATRESADAVTMLDARLRSSVDLQLRADVTVGGYLSGGLDSSITCALAKEAARELRTFSITFADERLDESAFQRALAAELGTRHTVQPIGQDEIAPIFPEVVRHAETPLLRTAPAPMYLLAQRTRESGLKVVLTGEGADELFLGYDLFKEVAVRQFCMRRPDSAWRPLLFDRLYPYLSDGGKGGDFWRSFFLQSGGADDPLFSHLPRFALTSRIKDFYGPRLREGTHGVDALQRLRDELPAGFGEWSPLNRAAYLELVTLLEPYLLSSQGDRMSMAHGLEGRYPFLDNHLFRFSADLPVRSKLRVLREKDILRRWSAGVLPPRVSNRPKQPYRAPDIPAFISANTPEYVDALLAPEAVRDAGYFEPAAVAGLLRRARAGRATGFRENQAFVAMLSTQLWHEQFMKQGSVGAPLEMAGADVVLDGRSQLAVAI